MPPAPRTKLGQAIEDEAARRPVHVGELLPAVGGGIAAERRFVVVNLSSHLEGVDDRADALEPAEHDERPAETSREVGALRDERDAAADGQRAEDRDDVRRGPLPTVIALEIVREHVATGLLVGGDGERREREGSQEERKGARDGHGAHVYIVYPLAQPWETK